MSIKVTEAKAADMAQIAQMQAVILGIMKAIDKVCREHNLQYFMIAGTMLGAIRHKGFIPWDDDADVALPRPDYDVLMAHANEWLPEEYELVEAGTTPCYPYQFARVQDKRTTYITRRCFNFAGGIPVDVFPLDGMTTHKLKRYIHYKKYNFFKRLYYYSVRDPYKHGKCISAMLVLACHKLLSRKWLHHKLDCIQKEFPYHASELVADHDNKPCRGILPKDVYGTPTPYAFAGATLMGVAKPHEYLSCCYGRYMEMPRRRPLLNYRYVDVARPYATFGWSLLDQKS